VTNFDLVSKKIVIQWLNSTFNTINTWNIILLVSRDKTVKKNVKNIIGIKMLQRNFEYFI